MQECANLAELEKSAKLNLFLQKSAAIQPRMGPPKHYKKRNILFKSTITPYLKPNDSMFWKIVQ